MKLYNAVRCLFLVKLCCLLQIMPILSAVGTDFSFQLFSADHMKISSINAPRYISMPGAVIDESGTYCISKNIVFNPVGSDETCILIDADNVILDLALHSIVQADGNIQTGAIGIEVAAGRKNVMVRNGSVCTFTGTGLLVNDNTQIVRVANLSVIDCGKGILFDGATLGIADVGLLSILVSGLQDSASACGIEVDGVRTLLCEDVLVSSSRDLTGNFEGVRLNNCASGSLKNCVCSQNASSGLQTIAYHVLDCDNIGFVDCNCAHNVNTGVAPGSLAIGFLIGNSQEILLRDCVIANQLAALDSVGIEFNLCMNSFVLNCQIVDNSGDNGTGIFFHNGRCNGIRRCTIQANNAGVGNANGIFFQAEINSSILENDIKANNGITGSFGIHLDTCTDCEAGKNKVALHSVAGLVNGIGIFDASGVGLTTSILGNIASKNEINFSPGTPTILIFPGPLTVDPSVFENISL